MKIDRRYTIGLLLISTILAGCATNRSELKISTPAPVPASQTAQSGKPVLIRNVTDERIFEQAPKIASIPSLGFEGALQASAETKARAIGRKRNSFGKAMGDILLQNGQTVTGLVRENLTHVFQSAGYRVVAESESSSAPLIVDVHIKQFWTWMQPGFWALTLNANIETDLEISGASSPTKINVHVEDSRQMATDGAWLEVLEKGLGAYRAQLVSKLPASP